MCEERTANERRQNLKSFVVLIFTEASQNSRNTTTTNNRTTPDLVVLGRAQLSVQVPDRVGRHAGESRQPQVGGQAQVGGAGDVGRERSEGVEVLRHLGGAGQGLRHGHRHRQRARGNRPPALVVRRGRGHHGLGLHLGAVRTSSTSSSSATVVVVVGVVMVRVVGVVEVVEQAVGALELDLLLGPAHQVQGRVQVLALAQHAPCISTTSSTTTSSSSTTGAADGRVQVADGEEARGSSGRPHGAVGAGQQRAGLADHGGRQRVPRVVGGGGQLRRRRGDLGGLQVDGGRGGAVQRSGGWGRGRGRAAGDFRRPGGRGRGGAVLAGRH